MPDELVPSRQWFKNDSNCIKTGWINNPVMHTSEGPDEYFWDDVHKKILDYKGVQAARAQEIAFAKKMGLYNIVPISECYRLTGKAPIRTRWVDTDKGDGNLRSRLVAMDFKTGKGQRWDLYSPTPPLEVIKVQLALVSSEQSGSNTHSDPVCVCYTQMSPVHISTLQLKAISS